MTTAVARPSAWISAHPDCGVCRLDDVLLAYRALQTDHTLRLECSNHGDDLLLGSFDVANLDRARRALQQVEPQ